jgi:hypothetical protein
MPNHPSDYNHAGHHRTPEITDSREKLIKGLRKLRYIKSKRNLHLQNGYDTGWPGRLRWPPKKDE